MYSVWLAILYMNTVNIVNSRFDVIVVWATLIIRVSDKVVIVPQSSRDYHNRDGDNYRR